MDKIKYVLILAVVISGFVFWNNYNSGSNKEAEKVTNDGLTTVSIQSVENASSEDVAGAVLAGSKTVKWETSNYPTGVGVNLNLIRKVSDSPIKFELVRVISANTVNDGQETWTLGSGESTDDLYIEVTCSTTYEFSSGCGSSSEAVKVN